MFLQRNRHDNIAITARSGQVKKRDQHPHCTKDLTPNPSPEERGGAPPIIPELTNC